MFDLASQQVRDGLEATVRVIRSTDRLARRVLHRSHLVEQQEGIDRRDVARRKRTTHDEAPALGLTVRRDEAEHSPLVQRFTVNDTGTVVSAACLA